MREVVAGERMIRTDLHLVFPRLQIMRPLTLLHADELRRRRIGVIEREVVLVIETVVEEL